MATIDLLKKFNELSFEKKVIVVAGGIVVLFFLFIIFYGDKRECEKLRSTKTLALDKPVSLGKNGFGVDITLQLKGDVRQNGRSDILLLTDAKNKEEALDNVIRIYIDNGKIYLNHIITSAGINETIRFEQIDLKSYSEAFKFKVIVYDNLATLNVNVPGRAQLTQSKIFRPATSQYNMKKIVIGSPKIFRSGSTIRSVNVNVYTAPSAAFNKCFD